MSFTDHYGNTIKVVSRKVSLRESYPFCGEQSEPLENMQESGSRERVTRDFSRLPQMESLPAG